MYTFLHVILLLLTTVAGWTRALWRKQSLFVFFLYLPDSRHPAMFGANKSQEGLVQPDMAIGAKVLAFPDRTILEGTLIQKRLGLLGKKPTI